MARLSVFLVVLIAASLLVAGCSSLGNKNSDTSVQSQLKSNQAVLLVLQNQAVLDQLYFTYNGQGATAQNPYGGQAQGMEQIGELNLMMHNIGSSVSAGGLYVSGYDPNLIKVRARPGQIQINENHSTCKDGYTDIAVVGTGRYTVTKYCQLDDRTAIGGVFDDNGGVLSGINVPFGDWINHIRGVKEGDNSMWTAAIGLFNDNRVDCGLHDGKFGCQISFGNPNFDVNRASYGYRLIDMLQADLTKCEDYCRPFPPRINSGVVLHGVSDEYPLGDTLYYDYDVWLNKSSWNPLLNDLKQTIQITACYTYTTTITPTVCVDPDPSINYNDACKTTPIVFKEPQGAPVKVTRIEQRSQPGRMTYTIYLEHVGGGQLWNPGAFPECGPYYNGRPNPRDMNVVQLLDARILGQMDQLECMPKDAQGKYYVRFENGKGQITCNYVPHGDDGVRTTSAYTSAITLEFGYVYQNVVRKDVIIHRT